MKTLLSHLPPGAKVFARNLTRKLSGESGQPAKALDRGLKVPGALRCGVIGLGVMGENHAAAVHQHTQVSLVGLTSTHQEKRAIALEFGCTWFESAEQMIQSGDVDLVIIATPHWQHADLSISALRAGLHVICEKPLSVTVGQADEVLRAAQESRGLLSVVCQTRFEPGYQRVKLLLSSGELGPIIRCEMVETFWRSAAYYRSNSWRGTWKGEGGGVLINQAPHVLDRYVWFCGMPESVTGFCDTALHEIEVEDSASALFRHPGGWHGHVHVSTDECPWLSRTVIVCDRGRITIENGSVRVDKLRHSIRERTKATTSSFHDIEFESRKVKASLSTSVSDLLRAFYENVALAITGKQELMVSGEDGARALELANATLLSSATGCTVRLPVDRAAYDAFIAGKTGFVTLR